MGLNGASGVVSASQLILQLDALASAVKAQWANLQTLNTEFKTARQKALGDGTTSFPGLGNPVLESALVNVLQTSVQAARPEQYFFRLTNGLISPLESNIQGNLPSGWRFLASGTAATNLDAHIRRLNACSPGVPAMPTSGAGSTGTLTAVNRTAGAIPAVSAGSAPYVCHTAVGANDCQESLPCAVATQVAIAAPNNAYQYAFPAGNVPSGWTKVRIYRTAIGGSSIGPFYYDQTVNVTAGSAFPTVYLTNPDSALRQDWNPPSWLSCLIVPEAALLIALSYVQANSQAGAQDGPVTFQSGFMLNPYSCVLCPSNGVLGVNVPPAQGAQFGSTVIGTGFTAGAIQTANTEGLGLQGYLGATALRARVTASPNGTWTPTIAYTYYDAAHGYGNTQTATGQTPVAGFTNGQTVGTAITWTIPGGRVVLSVSETSTSGTATSGAYVYEADYARSY